MKRDRWLCGFEDFLSGLLPFVFSPFWFVLAVVGQHCCPAQPLTWTTHLHWMECCCPHYFFLTFATGNKWHLIVPIRHEVLHWGDMRAGKQEHCMDIPTWDYFIKRSRMPVSQKWVCSLRDANTDATRTVPESKPAGPPLAVVLSLTWNKVWWDTGPINATLSVSVSAVAPLLS